MTKSLYNDGFDLMLKGSMSDFARCLICFQAELTEWVMVRQVAFREHGASRRLL